MSAIATSMSFQNSGERAPAPRSFPGARSSGGTGTASLLANGSFSSIPAVVFATCPSITVFN
ncbi:Uncharacterised protein [Collinsella intestinalis]|nr:Uncharacterised protein [Collinsella intestinalis]VWM25484.1 Uncharacterised protein [Collinsella intestinalis]